MVYHPARALDATFAALADPTRRAIVARLSSGERSISELAQPFDMSLPAVSKHVRVLERAGLARVRREGRVRYCRLDAAPMGEAARWMERYRQFWEAQFDSLARYLAEPTPSLESDPWPAPSPRPRPTTRSASRASSPPRKRGSSGRGRGRTS